MVGLSSTTRTRAAIRTDHDREARGVLRSSDSAFHAKAREKAGFDVVSRAAAPVERLEHGAILRVDLSTDVGNGGSKFRLPRTPAGPKVAPDAPRDEPLVRLVH